MENMSLAPYLLAKARTGYRMGDGLLEDHLLRDGLMCAVNDYHMGMTAENVAERYGITPRGPGRVRPGEPAPRRRGHGRRLRSRTRSCRCPSPRRRATPCSSTPTSIPRPETTLEELAKLKPAFKKDGTVTAGNSSGVNDAAAALVLASREFAEKRGLKPLARDRRLRLGRARPGLHGHGPLLRHAQGHGEDRHDASTRWT